MTSIQIEVEVTDQTLDDIIVTALEGGIGYWCQASVYEHTEGQPHRAIVHQLNEDESGYEHRGMTIDRAAIIDGLKRLAPKYSTQLGRLVNDDYDSDDADVVVQMALFGDVIYG